MIAPGEEPPVKPRVLVAIANHGTKNRHYLDRLLAEYRAMGNYALDVVVLSNVPKDLGPDIEVRVGLPSADPWSLPFAHKRLFAERSEDYDLFIYSEDDTLLTERGIEAFQEATRVLPDDCIAGFMRFEVDPQGRKFCSSIHSHYHWDIRSVVRHGGFIFARHTNEHAACFILTRMQLKRAIASGGFLLPPERRDYGMPETAATDPYSQCGMRKLICISHFDDFLLHHLPNVYCGKLGLAEESLRLELAELASFVADGSEPQPGPLFEPFPLGDADRWNKPFYERARKDMLAAIPAGARRVLSVGCGSGETEAELIKRGMEVTAVPLDPVIATLAAAKGIETLPADFRLATVRLGERRFDCILMPDILQQLPDPAAIVDLYREFLAEDGMLVVSVPNWNYYGTLRQRFAKWGRRALKCRAAAGRPGVHKTTDSLVRRWLRSGGYHRIDCTEASDERFAKHSKRTFGMMDWLFAPKLILIARR